MKFFIPLARNDEEAEHVLLGIAKFARRAVPPPEEQIFRLHYEHNGKDYIAEVGKPIDVYYGAVGPVIAILGGNPLLVCLRDRGVLRGEPIYVNTAAVRTAEFFDE